MKTINLNRISTILLYVIKIGILLTINDSTALILNILLVVIEIVNLEMDVNRYKCTSLCVVRINKYTKSMRTRIMRLCIQLRLFNSYTSIISL
ncbi:hypothetical protein [Myroides marinus]|uniref:hypothetical protein n=1 Tax=Myroides marinus TaxID=703342 RepID=UPI002579219F|nr:hypothetical protein [Myroides marinus]MDM1534086.1 hypothetical protein [Myroides marinus]MDM1541081.1 hypothetical protein [Myroides marinus]